MQLSMLDRVTVGTPCTADWGRMRGDERVRFCTQCRKHVYNLSAMTADEAMGLIDEKEGNLCARLYRRNDGTVVTADCRSLRRRLQFSLRAVMTLITALAAVFGIAARVHKEAEKAHAETHEVLMGAMVAPPVMGKLAAPPCPPAAPQGGEEAEGPQAE
jgi:hypothetical protein